MLYLFLLSKCVLTQENDSGANDNNRDSGILIGILSLRRTTSDLNNTSYAKFISVSKFGDVTGVVNNAGVNSHADPVTMTDKEWDDFFAIDMKPVWLTAKLALPAMRKVKGGSIVNICSIHGRLTYPGFFPYGAAKSAVLGLTRNLALDEGKHEIRVNAVSPGFIAYTRIVVSVPNACCTSAIS